MGMDAKSTLWVLFCHGPEVHQDNDCETYVVTELQCIMEIDIINYISMIISP